MRIRNIWRAVVVLAVTATMAAGGGTAQAASGSTADNTADPDMIQVPDGRYFTYSTSSGGRTVPVHITTTPGIGGKRAVKDAMPGGPGAWASSCKGVWAPTVVRHGGRYLMYYTATRAGTGGCGSSSSHGQKCIGVATSSRPGGPFTGGRQWACPKSGRWAIDADAFVHGGKVFVVYRDDAVTRGAETGISVVGTYSSGMARWSTRRTLLTSRAMTWDTKGSPAGGTHIVENPTLLRTGGSWQLFWSGNSWNSPRYATGRATCGKALLDGRCRPTHTARPWFGYRGPGGINPVRGLPANHKGPGGMSVFKTNKGSTKVIWHWWGKTAKGKTIRRAMTGSMSSTYSVR